MYIHYICLTNVCVYFLIYVQLFSIYLFLSGIFLYYSIFIVFFFLFISSLKICTINFDIYLFITSPSKSISSLLPTKIGVIFLICQSHLVALILSQICSLTLKNYLNLSLLFPGTAAVSNGQRWEFMTISPLRVMILSDFHFCRSHPYGQNCCESYVQLLCCVLKTLLLHSRQICLAPRTLLPLFPS